MQTSNSEGSEDEKGKGKGKGRGRGRGRGKGKGRGISMKHKKQNPFDVLVENLINEFSKIKNFNLLSEDERGKQMFNFVTYRMSEIASMKTLYANTFLPAVNKNIVESIKLMKVSR